MPTTLTLRNIRARPVMVPLRRPPQSASGAIAEAALVLLDLETEEGITGRSYVFPFSRAMLKPTVACVDALAEMLRGDALMPFEIEAKLRKRLTLLDTPGLVGIALAGIDIAAWDAQAKALGVPLVR
ncbi:MAG: enolase C-terminal domain-like protein, partial [Burkholderiales bacterium]